MMLGQLVTFAGICLVLALTPGLDTALVARNVLVRGRQAGLLTALGIALGLYIHASAVALGVATLLQRSVTAFTALKLCGATYLGFLGIRALLASFKRRPGGRADRVASRPTAPGWIRALHPDHPFVQGLLCDVSNPKAFLFFLTFLPQFLTPGQPRVPFALALATICAGINLSWMGLYALYAVLLGRLSPLVQRSSVQRWLDRVTGLICLAFGLHLVADRQA